MKLRVMMVSGVVAALAACGIQAVPGARAPVSASPQDVASAPSYVVQIPVPAARPRVAASAPRVLDLEIERLVRAFGGKTGVAIRAVDEGWTVEANGRTRMPQQSVSKLWVAMTLLDQRDAGRVRLDDPIAIRAGDLTLFHQPSAYLVKGGAFNTTVGNLLIRALTQSDNTANDRLLTLVGGPSAVRGFIDRKQLGDIRFGPGERLLQARTAGMTWDQSMSVGNTFAIRRAQLDPAVRQRAFDAYAADPIDGAAPLAIADALARLARGELLSETSTRVMLDTMGAARTGHARLRAGMAPGWAVAHKTGTGQDLGRRTAGFNDVGLVTAPDGRRYTVAVMIGDTSRSVRERQLLIQAVANALTSQRPVQTMAGGGRLDSGS